MLIPCPKGRVGSKCCCFQAMRKSHSPRLSRSSLLEILRVSSLQYAIPRPARLANASYLEALLIFVMLLLPAVTLLLLLVVIIILNLFLSNRGISNLVKVSIFFLMEYLILRSYTFEICFLLLPSNLSNSVFVNNT